MTTYLQTQQHDSVLTDTTTNMMPAYLMDLKVNAPEHEEVSGLLTHEVSVLQ